MRFQKILLALLILFTLSIYLNSCATSGTARDSSNLDQLLIENPDLELKDYLRRLSGINIMDSGGTVTVKIRGTSSISTDTSPLFIIDGIRVGTSYEAAANSLSMKDVDYIRIVRPSEAMTTYGMTAANGAIVVYTKQR